MPDQRSKQVAGALLVFAAYFATGHLGLRLATVNASATPIWLPTGVAIAGCLLLGRIAWPSIFLAALSVNWLNLESIEAFGTAFGIAVGNTLMAVVGSLLIMRFAGGTSAFELPGRIFVFVALAAIASMVSASVGSFCLWLSGRLHSTDAFPVWSTWWIGDSVGVLMACPLIVLLATERGGRWTTQQFLEAVALLLTVVSTGIVVFEGLFPGGRPDYPLEFICLPGILWAALRFGRREAACASFLLLGIALHGSLRELGPFSPPSRNETLLLLQTYMGITTVTGLVVAAMVAERKRLQAELGKRAGELAGSNKELEQYAYIASHDLQEPLRLITMYSQLMSQEEGKLDERSRGYLGYIVQNVDRMLAFIKGLLEYSRVGRSGDKPAPVDLGEVCWECRETLRAAIQESHADLLCEPLPIVMGSRLELKQLMQNLIANAIKFRRNVPHIRITAVREQDQWRISVKDDGIGIDPKEAERLFEVFQRLHSGTEYPGSGIGLAVCKKIVERHGGSIRIEPTSGGGSTFVFTLPAATKALG